MYLTRHNSAAGPRWAVDGKLLPAGVTLSTLLALPDGGLLPLLAELATDEEASGQLLAPVDNRQEVWGSGVTYLRSRDARKAESETASDVYQKVYDAERPEIFFKQVGWRTLGHGQPVRVRADTTWNVPEPELCLVINAASQIVGYTVGNDMSSRDIEGENPLYLPQAKTYDGSAAGRPRHSPGERRRADRPCHRHGDRARRSGRLRRRDRHQPDEALLPGPGRLSDAGVGLPLRRAADDRHRHRPARRVHPAKRRSGQDHNRGDDAGKQRGLKSSFVTDAVEGWFSL